jgi:hypothetical protein
MARENNLVAAECALGRARMECDAKRDRAMTVQQDYWARLRASIAGHRRSLDFHRVLSGHQFTLSVQEADLEW